MTQEAGKSKEQEAAEKEYPYQESDYGLHIQEQKFRREHFIAGAEWQASQPTPESQWPTAEEIEKAFGVFLDKMKMGATLKNTWFGAIQWLRTSGIREGTEIRDMLEELVNAWEHPKKDYNSQIGALMVKAEKLLSKTN